MTPAASKGRRFAVAFSYAGEDRDRVAPLAEALAERFGRQRVLYDRFHEAEFARPNLDLYLPALYRDQSELIVVLLSPEYPRKAWCGLELRWIRQLLLGPGSERILLLSLGNPGDLSGLGLLPTDGYLEVSRRPTAEVVARILERLALQGEALQGVALQGVAVPGSAPGAGGLSRVPAKGMALLAAGLLAAGVLAVPLAWRLAQSPRVQRVYVAPGNGGTAREPLLTNLPITDLDALADGDEVRAGVKTGAATVGALDRFDHRADGAFAVGAGDVDARGGALGIAEAGGEQTHAVHAEARTQVT